jgi:hypothetical protein
MMKIKQPEWHPPLPLLLTHDPGFYDYLAHVREPEGSGMSAVFQKAIWGTLTRDLGFDIIRRITFLCITSIDDKILPRPLLLD